MQYVLFTICDTMNFIDRQKISDIFSCEITSLDLWRSFLACEGPCIEIEIIQVWEILFGLKSLLPPLTWLSPFSHNSRLFAWM